MNSTAPEFCRSVKLRGLCFMLELFHFSIFFALVKNFRSALSLAFQNARSCHLNVKTDEMRAFTKNYEFIFVQHFKRCSERDRSQCGDLKTRSWKCTSMKPQSIQNRYAYSLIDVLNTKNKKHLARLDMSEKTWILCQGGLWTERRTFSLLNVSLGRS